MLCNFIEDGCFLSYATPISTHVVVADVSNIHRAIQTGRRQGINRGINTAKVMFQSTTLMRA
jgi:hypothetical protein